MHIAITRLAACALLALSLLACGDSTSSDGSAATVLIASRTTSSMATTGATTGLTLTSGGHTLVVTKAQVVLAEVELKATSSMSCADDQERDDCAEVRVDPILVDLPLGAVKTLDVGALLPPGSYREIELDVDAVESGEHSGSAAFLAANPAFRNVSIRVEGTYDGKPFTFVTAQDFEVEIELAPPFVAGASASSLTLNIDVGAWFQSGSTLLDPSNAGSRSLIHGNIDRSIRAFKDDNRDGREDG